MQIEPFALERYFARHEFSARYLLSPSDCESWRMSDLLSLADAETRLLWENLRLGYTESEGHPLLRDEIARFYAPLTARQVLTAAPEEAIFIAMNGLLDAGDRVVVLEPAYQSLHAVARALGARVESWPLVVEGGRWSLDLNRLQDLLRASTRLVVVNFPNNPTGYLPTPGEWEELISLVRRSGAFLFSDEMYRLLEYDPSMRLPPACTCYERAISLAGLSKAFGLPGLRMGWLACADAAGMEKFQIFKDYTTICSSAPSEVLSIIALRSQEMIVERNLAIVRENLATARAFFGAQGGRFAWIDPCAGSVAFPRWLGEKPVEELAEEAVTRAGVMMVPGSMFGYGGGHFRVGLGRRNLPEVLSALGSYLGQKGG
ncbi:MAG TPA: aminotransferase class V-fold PLP-dependent enzyme [Anaerolinea thermolimosa]|uniref:Aminotransferase n=1 Tax=Anaerolinea thermolimosa TaxID=229919 RepID=A0A3D1JD36_9CHLR|nr:aminotransferase class I/II-fold pyridoxal phosphate-dependent enzyme [Anaerolinea thermolimosa]GAP08217.1 aspartate/tyrosine/aromatic aminotransferase [Anaerolinea thermolimosa]HCE16500.1 aminotransferase class V-fold PLP-dependent enzyme [Anaerolinea thermolimosa]